MSFININESMRRINLKTCPECKSKKIKEGHFSNGYVSSVRLIGENPFKSTQLNVEYCKNCGYVVGMRAESTENL